MIIRHLLTLLTLIVITGCASNKMIESSNQAIQKPSSDESLVVFLRSSWFGRGVQASLFDVSSNESEFIGIISAGKKVAYVVEPGVHKFMVVSEAADFLEADLVGGRTYFAMVTPRMGAWKARFSLHPVRNGPNGEFLYDSDEFQGWLKSTQFTENTAESLEWVQQNIDSIEDSIRTCRISTRRRLLCRVGRQQSCGRPIRR